MPRMLLDEAMAQLNEGLEKEFSGVLLNLIEEARIADNKKSHEEAADIAIVARRAYNKLMSNPEATIAD